VNVVVAAPRRPAVPEQHERECRERRDGKEDPYRQNAG